MIHTFYVASSNIDALKKTKTDLVYDVHTEQKPSFLSHMKCLQCEERDFCHFLEATVLLLKAMALACYDAVLL